MGKRDRGRIEIRVCARAPVLHACVYAIQTSDSQRNDKKGVKFLFIHIILTFWRRIFLQILAHPVFKMQPLEVSCAVRRIYTSLGAKGLNG